MTNRAENPEHYSRPDSQLADAGVARSTDPNRINSRRRGSLHDSGGENRLSVEAGWVVRLAGEAA